MYALTNDHIYTGGEILDHRALVVADGIIDAICHHDATIMLYDLSGRFLPAGGVLPDTVADTADVGASGRSWGLSPTFSSKRNVKSAILSLFNRF
ncbi:hypothetical protein BG74_01905 [Sodalis-like endosymbiont of Proechinophthirus fluctus]|uniref:hypothetical protein n=1 Tax=Sodalis-like endosymbiont of Proechinophthirus fluctus TaxID=1462730 RepID=UPI0007A8EC63|nr:hypothetical protein [Sodalis-like endosymbiont of Proechinophthirus fluctus]KYP97603.1 hypothetical protein BG74_01905 [Sodalis-like endosymbiont of Proechinophthirus fluctus]